MKSRQLIALIISAGFFYNNLLNAAPRATLPGDGASDYACAVTTERDVDAMGKAVSGSLMNRIELYNCAINPLCQFDIYFTFQNRTISISTPFL